MSRKRNFVFSLFMVLMLLTGCGPTSEPSSETPQPSSEPPVTSEVSSEEPPLSEVPVVDPTQIVIKHNNEEVNTVSIEIGENIQLSANVFPENASQDVTWLSVGPNIASVSEEGVLTGIKKGFTTLSVSSKIDESIVKIITIIVTFDDPQTGIGSGLSPEDPIYKGDDDNDAPLEIYVLETFQVYADSLFIKKGNVEIIIDGGQTIDGVMNKDFIASKVHDGRLDMVIASHSHTDHVNAMPAILGEIDQASYFMDSGYDPNDNYGRQFEIFNNRGAKRISAYDAVNGLNNASKNYYFTKDFYVEILDTGRYHPNLRRAENPNSLALIFHYKDFTFYTAGDLETPQEQEILVREPNLPKVNLLKLSHHGSHGSNCQEFLDAMDPHTIVIPSSRSGLSNGQITPTSTKNLDAVGFHPRDPAVERTYKAPRISENLNVYWNVANGTLKFTTHGGADDLVVEGSPTRNGYYDLTLTNGEPVWNEEIQDFENKVTGEENKKFHETKAFVFRGYINYLPEWARNEFFHDWNGKAA